MEIWKTGIGVVGCIIILILLLILAPIWVPLGAIFILILRVRGTGEEKGRREVGDDKEACR